MKHRIDISIGPVQGFVSQSRRTRDLWGSSYLLAFLSAHAMHGAENAGGKIVQPKVNDDALFQWVSGKCDSSDPPAIGSVPNHFVVETDDDPKTVADTARASFDSAWKQVCNAVWERYIEDAAPIGYGTEAIWNRQIESFWEVVWTAGPSSDKGGGLLARRKHWRSHRPDEEPGDKCTVMHDLQELSGFVRAQKTKTAKQQNNFWKKIQNQVGKLDIRDKERLCAIALIKRLFPRVAKKAIGWEVDRSHWPSTVYIGAVPWIRRVIEVAPDIAKEYADAAGKAASDSVFPMQTPPFAGLNSPASGNFAKLDGNYFHRIFVASKEQCPLKEDAKNEVADRNELKSTLKSIYEHKGDDGLLGAPSSFYALLLADGDRLGKLVSGLGGDVVGKALASFTNDVPEIVRNNDGVTIYAGGDDVLAMLPVPNALACAEAISNAYRSSFDKTSVKGEATLSAAVVFAHIRMPLSEVLRKAHHLLDDVAKDGNGRDSLGVTVLKPGGMYCQWVTAWERGEENAVKQIDDLTSELNADNNEPGLSSSLIYRVRDTLSMLCDWDRDWDSWNPGRWGKAPNATGSLEPYLRAEIFRSLDIRDDQKAKTRAKAIAAKIEGLLRPARNNANANDAGSEVGVDALLLARFLANPDDSEAHT